MRYILLIYGDEQAWAGMSSEEQGSELQGYNEYSQWLRDKGWFEAGEPLHATSSATTVRVRDAETVTTDGPFAETKEQLGGFYIVNCENLDQAIDAASRIPAARGGSIEVRPILEIEGAPES
jgi:hypothetical protein